MVTKNNPEQLNSISLETIRAEEEILRLNYYS